MPANIQIAYNWAVETCAKPNVGYSQQFRNQVTVNGITYYDCSSFVWYALIAGGFDMVGEWGTWPFTTGTMGSVLKKMGFTKYPATVISIHKALTSLDSKNTQLSLYPCQIYIS